MDMADILAQTRLFEDIPGEDLNKLVGLAGEKQFTAGQYLFREGTAATDIYLVASGQVLFTMMVMLPTRRILREINVSSVGAQGTLGFWALTPSRRYALSAKALVDTTCVTLNGEALLHLVAGDPRLEILIQKRATRLIVERLDQVEEALAHERAQRMQ